MPAFCVEIDKLSCASVLGKYGYGKDWKRFHSGFKSCRAMIDAIRADSVLYLPDAKLQLLQDGVVPEESLQSPWYLEFEKNRHFQGKLDKYLNPFEVEEENENVCVLSNLYSRNFSHWISEEMIRVIILEESGFGGKYVLDKLPAYAHKLMEIIGIPNDRIIDTVESPTLFRYATFTPAISKPQCLEYRDVYLALRARLLAAVEGVRHHHGSRIWMIRSAYALNGRTEMVNADDVYRILDKYQFEVLDMAALPLTEQISVSRDADVLAGPHGAGFVHTLFLKPKSMVVECFLPEYINPSVLEICRLLEHDYSMLVHTNAHGAYADGGGLRVDCSHLELTLQGLARLS
jgi:hypothetical protein